MGEAGEGEALAKVGRSCGWGRGGVGFGGEGADCMKKKQEEKIE